MMKFSIALLITICMGWGVGTVGGVPWWGFVLSSAMVGALVKQSALPSFLAGFLGMFIAWGGSALWIDWQNKSLLSQKIANLLSLGGSSIALIFITALLGGLLSGFASLSGHFARVQLIKSK